MTKQSLAALVQRERERRARKAINRARYERMYKRRAPIKGGGHEEKENAGRAADRRSGGDGEH
jgi:hypothetical protein